VIDFTALKRSIDIVHVIGQRVSLQRRGDAMVGCCPFHDDGTPSFSVYANRGRFRCWGCNAQGDAIDFVARFEHCTLPDAVERCAAHVTMLPRKPPPPTYSMSVEEVRAVWDYCVRAPSNPVARAWAQDRKLDRARALPLPLLDAPWPTAPVFERDDGTRFSARDWVERSISRSRALLVPLYEPGDDAPVGLALRFTAPNAKPKNLAVKGTQLVRQGAPRGYGGPWDFSKTVVVVEGLPDTLAAQEMWPSACVVGAWSSNELVKWAPYLHGSPLVVVVQHLDPCAKCPKPWECEHSVGGKACKALRDAVPGSRPFTWQDRWRPGMKDLADFLASRK